MSTHSRTYNSVANSIYGIVASIVTVALNFAVRVVLVRQLGEEINGINSLFQSVISMMALMEMGISSAMIIHLYEPVKNEDRRTISAIMGFYRCVYLYVAGGFALVGVLVSLFLIDRLVTSSIPTGSVRLYFLLFTATFVLNYLTYYKRSLLFAEQKNRVSTTVTAVCELVFRTAQIAMLLVWQSYVLFLLLLMSERLVSNYICQRYVDRYHPYLKHNNTAISREKKQAIFKTVRPLMVNQTATTLQGTASSILISLLLGNVAIVGYFGVYLMVVSVIRLLYGQLGSAFTTSFGSLAVENDHQHMEWTYRRTAFLFNWIACVCGAVFIACVDDFVFLFFGQNFVLDQLSVFIITSSMLVGLINIPVISIQNAMGLHQWDATALVIQAVAAIAMGYAMGLLWGMPGILIGLLIPTVCISLFRKGIVICRVAFSMPWQRFLRFILPDIARIFGVVFLTSFVITMVSMAPSLGSIVLKAAIALALSISIPMLTSLFKPEFRATIKLAQTMASKVSKRKHHTYAA